MAALADAGDDDPPADAGDALDGRGERLGKPLSSAVASAAIPACSVLTVLAAERMAARLLSAFSMSFPRVGLL
jgi:hypothetical protein